MNESKEKFTFASKIHGAGSAIGFMALMFFTLLQMTHNYRNYQGGGSALIAIGAVLLGMLLLSLKQYILEKDYLGIIILSILSLIFIVSGVFVKRWAHKKEKADIQRSNFLL